MLAGEIRITIMINYLQENRANTLMLQRLRRIVENVKLFFSQVNVT